MERLGVVLGWWTRTRCSNLVLRWSCNLLVDGAVTRLVDCAATSPTDGAATSPAARRVRSSDLSAATSPTDAAATLLPNGSSILQTFAR
jgi:hypothetical protein